MSQEIGSKPDAEFETGVLYVDAHGGLIGELELTTNWLLSEDDEPPEHSASVRTHRERDGDVWADLVFSGTDDRGSIQSSITFSDIDHLRDFGEWIIEHADAVDE